MVSLSLGCLALFFCFYVHQVHANSGQIFVTTSLVNFDARIVEVRSGGDEIGDRWSITNDSNHPFVGREIGAANRWTLKGSQTFGSGYPYGNVDNTTIAGRPFPYGLWPLYWGNNMMGSGEYGPALDGVRPGGQLVTIPLKTEDGAYDITEGEMYHIIGDRDSATYMMISLVRSCHVSPAWPTKFDPTSPNSTVRMENVIQYYRASSFALASPGYNNTFARSSLNTESTGATPIPDTIRYSEFHKCLDDVIMNALGIMNWAPGYSPTPIADAIWVTFILLTCTIIIVLWFVHTVRFHWRNIKRKWRAAKRRKAEMIAARNRSLMYEMYP